MLSTDALLHALPIRDIKTRAGTYGNCAGVAGAVVDFEAGTADSPGVEVVDAVDKPPDWTDDRRDVAGFCVEHVGIGAKQALADLFGTEPPIRLIVRWVHTNLIDAHERVNQKAGRLAVEEAIRIAALTGDRDR